MAADAGAAVPADAARPLSPDATEGGRITKWLVGIAAVVMLAGLLFGYDQGIIAARSRASRATSTRARSSSRSSRAG